MRNKQHSIFARLFLGFLFCFVFFAIGISNVEAQQTGIGLIELRELAGAENVDGSGVNLLQVEAGTLIYDDDENPIGINYSPEDPNYNQLDTKTFEEFGNLPSLGNAQGHARSVAQEIYGYLGTRPPRNQFGSAPAIGSTGNPTIKILSAYELINFSLGSGNTQPIAQNFDVSNHSYVINLDPANDFGVAEAEDLLRRMDYVINNGNMTMVVGSSNSPNGELPAGFVQAYNTINVGVSDGSHAFGPTTLNGLGRNSIHVTVAHNYTSFATPRVSGAAAILHQTGAGTDAVKHEVIKATILAGATKDDLVDGSGVSVTWNHTQTQPLDNRYGAGELNVLNNHLIQQGGEVNGGATSTTAATAGINGWDYEDALAPNDERFYEFTVAAGEEVENFSIALAWNLEVVDGNGSPFAFSAQANELANLSLELIDVSDNSTVDLSDSSVDNVEHIFRPVLPSGTYQLRVANGSNNVDTDYGLAFGGTVVDAVLLGDCNLDGVVDFFDIAALIGFLTSGEYLEQADCNQDGVVDFFDIAAFIGLVT